MLCAAEAVGGPRADRHRVDQGELEEASYLFNRQVLQIRCGPHTASASRPTDSGAN